MSEQQKDQKGVSFKDTLNLPETDFPIRANAKVDDPALIERWQKENLFRSSFDHNAGNQSFILHDGPPYANGNIHIGHAYNKILKDIVGKSQRMLGKRVPIVPGWDCHGLPIELKVSTANPGISPQELKKKCREYAQHWIDVQRQEFIRLGVLMDWDRPYTTMNHGYEAATLRSFGKLVADGYVERKNKTVPWCPSCKTVLASAEIEYKERKDPSIYVLFALEQSVIDSVIGACKGKQVSLGVWTTTPWTLPLNRAVLLKPDVLYAVLSINNEYVLVGKELAAGLCAMLDVECIIVAEIFSNSLVDAGARAHHPFVDDLMVPVLLDRSVLLQDGTACVHSAPGVGPEDYEVGVRNNLEIFSPISADGKYTAGIAPKELEGMSVEDGQIWVIKKLVEKGRLLHKSTIRHSYPHCWRCSGGLIFRATKQWFCDLQKNNLKERAYQATKTIDSVPENSINRLQATLEGRLEWCLSRQRVWGVPIPALLCKQCDHTYISQELIETVAQGVAEQGIEFWDTIQVADLVKPGFACVACAGTEFNKEMDILDVWFDSGVSHIAVLETNQALHAPADLYLEGKDQHRGWFQSSLLTSIALRGSANTKALLTHGYTVDGKGHKMSKSVGNVVSPQQMIDILGTDGVRLWAASLDTKGDAPVSEALNKNVQEVFRKIRNTCRFLLSNIYDFNKDTDAVPLDALLMIDKYALQELFAVNAQVIGAYVRYDFTEVAHILTDYCTTSLSSFYLDIIKDRLYVEKADGHARRSAQTACWYILDTMTRLMAPVASFTAEQLSDSYQKDKKESIHLQNFAHLIEIQELLLPEHETAIDLVDAVAQGTAINLYQLKDMFAKTEYWQVLHEVRSAVLKAIEELRERSEIKHSLEARVTLAFKSTGSLAPALEQFFIELTNNDETVAQFFKEFFIVSQFVHTDSLDGLTESSLPGLYLHIEHARGNKCPRCWNWDETDHEHHLCMRCQAVLAATK